MNIQKISLNTTMSVCMSDNDRKLHMPKYSITKTSPIACDTVSFQAKRGRKTLQALKAAVKAAEKKAEELVEELSGCVTEKKLPSEQKSEWKINQDLAERVHNSILKPQAYIRNFIHNLYDDLLYSEKSPKNPILEIHDREKSVYSISEKAATRMWSSEKEIWDNMTDLNGVKVVGRKKAGKFEMDYILDRLIPMIKTGQLELKEIEIKRPADIKHLTPKEQEKYDYASMPMLKKLVEVQEGVWNTKKTSKENIRKVSFGKPQYTSGNYCALHLLLDFPNNKARIFEAQFMGAYVGAGKDLDDIIFKIKDGKYVDKKYARIKELYEDLKADTTGALERFEQYRKKALLALREKEIREAFANKTTGKNINLFISAEKYNLPPEYDLTNLMALKEDCDKKSKAAKKAVESRRINNAEKRINELSKIEELIEKEKKGPITTKLMLDKLLEKFGSKKKSKKK